MCIHNFKCLRYILSILFSLLLLGGCSSGGGDGDVSVQNNQDGGNGIDLPVGVNVSALPVNGALQAYVSVDGGVRQQLAVDLNSQTINGSISGITPGSHSFIIEVVFVYDNNTEVMLASANINMDVAAGDNSLNVTSSDYTTAFDDDSDNVSNLDELNAGTDPTIPGDTDCIIGSSAIGNCLLG